MPVVRLRVAAFELARHPRAAAGQHGVRRGAPDAANTFQNPYLEGQVVLPELASAYLRRDATRPGMVLAAGPVIEAFSRIGWEWGGYWSSAKDYQHFSQNGR